MLLLGKPIAERILAETRSMVELFGITPGIGIVLVGDDAASRIYADIKEKRARELGFHFTKKTFPKTTSEDDVLDAVRAFNEDKNIHGIVVQLPLPHHINVDRVIATVNPKKDADGFLISEKNEITRDSLPRLAPVFPEAMVELARAAGVPFSAKKAIIFTNSDRFGKTMRDILRNEGANAEYFFADDIDANQSIFSEADFVFSALGMSGAFSEEMFKRGAVVIDGGISKQDEKVVGDVKAPEGNVRIFLSPVPGGVGPVTVACLLRRVVTLAMYLQEKEKTA